jgi:hypothetical protein
MRWSWAAALALCLSTARVAMADEPDVRGLVEAGHAPVATDDVYARRVALLVAIDDYEDPALRLRTAGRGAEGLRRTLEQRYGFDEVRVLTDREATREGVLSALASLRDLSPDDALMVFWAGHGATVTTDEGEQLGYLVPWDGALSGDRALVANLSMAELRSVLGRVIPARHKLLVVDACYGGLLTVREAPVIAEHDRAWLARAAREPVLQVITAGEAGQTVLDGGPGGQSVFTGHLLALLEGTEDFTTGTELAVALQRRVRADAFARGSHEQTPAFGRLSGTGDFLFLPKAPEPVALVQRGADLATLPVPRRSRTLALWGGGALAVGGASLLTTALTHRAYTEAPLSEGEQSGLFALNGASAAVGGVGLVLGSVGVGAALVVNEW